MSAPLPPLLVVDDEKNLRLSLTTILADEGYPVRAVESAEEALQLLAQDSFFMVITDARLGGMSGYEFLGRMHEKWPDLPTLMITAYATPKLAVEAIKAGAMNYLSKPFAPEELLHAVSLCAERHRLLQDNAQLRAHAVEEFRLDRLIGESPPIRELRGLIQRVAPTEATVLILGESGTGKELVAGALHGLSGRHTNNYERINCAAIPEALLESELFGHEKGAFTGALKQKPGRVEGADGGTLFLDEIADMSRPLQAKLLRFLEDGSFTRVGGNRELKVDVRLIAATNRDIVAAIHGEVFREDLFHRLNVFQFRLPPLRDRGQDVIMLADYFLGEFARSMRRPVRGLSRAAQQKLLNHRWPGNVRELRNVIERAVILETGDEVRPENLPDFRIEAQIGRAATAPVAPPTEPRSLDEWMEDCERRLILSVLDLQHYNLGKTADHLKLSRHQLRYRMQRLNIQAETEPEEATPATGRVTGR